MREPFKAMWQQGLSLTAIDTTTNELAGCLLACDYTRQSQTTRPIPKPLKPVNALLQNIEKTYKQERSFATGEYLLVDMAVVKPDYEGHGIYRNLREYAHAIGVDAGFNWVIGELSSAATQHLCLEHFGHTIKVEIDYASFDYKGTKPFVCIEEPSSIILVEGAL